MMVVLKIGAKFLYVIFKRMNTKKESNFQRKFEWCSPMETNIL